MNLASMANDLQDTRGFASRERASLEALFLVLPFVHLHSTMSLRVFAPLAAGTSAQMCWPNLQELEKEVVQAPQDADVEVEVGAFVNPKLCYPSVNQSAGYLKASASLNYFFWLSGGPGCSSQLALFGENGPCTVSEDGKSTIPNSYSWHMAKSEHNC